MLVVIVAAMDLRDFCSAMPESRPTINEKGIYASTHKSGDILSLIKLEAASVRKNAKN